jgi:hypothetical protein
MEPKRRRWLLVPDFAALEATPLEVLKIRYYIAAGF